MSPDYLVWFQMTRAQGQLKKNKKNGDWKRMRGRWRLGQEGFECQTKEFGLYPEGSEEPGRRESDHCGT